MRQTDAERRVTHQESDRRVPGGFRGRPSPIASLAETPMSEQQRGPLHWFGTHPFVVAICALLTLFGVPFSIYTYLESRKEKEPRYAMTSTNLVGHLPSRYQSLRILYEGKPISNFTVTKLAFWNSGKETIRDADIPDTDPLRIRSKAGCEILGASLIYTT